MAYAVIGVNRRRKARRNTVMGFCAVTKEPADKKPAYPKQPRDSSRKASIEDGRRLVKALTEIEDAEVRQALVLLAEALARARS